MKIQLGYSPHADDAYILFGLLNGYVDTGDLDIQAQVETIPVLNDLASRGSLEMTMLSTAAYAFVRDRYLLLSGGGKFGRGHGPVVVSREPLAEASLTEATIAIPGSTTTAYALLQLYDPTLRTRILPLDKLLPAVDTGLVQCALVIHEEFVEYKRYGLEVILNLAEWWAAAFDQLPMPVSVWAIRNDLPIEVQQQLAAALSASAKYSLAHHAEALDFAMQYSHGLDIQTVESFTKKFVHELSVDMSDAGRASLELFFDRTHQLDILPETLPLDIVG